MSNDQKLRARLAKKSKRAPRVKKPKHSTETRSYAFPIEVTDKGSEKLFAVLKITHTVREALVTARTENRAKVRENNEIPYLTKNDQYKFISQWSKTDNDLKSVHSQVLQNVADRIDEGTKRWFDALEEGKTHVRPPHSIPLNRAKSFTYTQYGTSAHINNGWIYLSKLGRFKLNDYRKMRGKKKSITIKFKDGRWWAIVTVELQAKDCFEPANDKPNVGADPGLKTAVALSSGVLIPPLKPLKKAEKQLKHEQRNMSRKFKARKAAWMLLVAAAKEAGVSGEDLPKLKDVPYSKRLIAQIKKVAKCHTKVANGRDHSHKKIASQLSDCHNKVAYEAHSIGFMLKNRSTSKSAADVGLADQRDAIESKIGDRFVPVPTVRKGIGGNSQTCLCGASTPKTLNIRWHSCPECGMEGDRDWISSLIIEHTAFGTINDSAIQVCGQQVCEKALALLKRRGGGKGSLEETHATESHIGAAVESSVRRHSTSKRVRHTAGGKPTAGGETI